MEETEEAGGQEKLEATTAAEQQVELEKDEKADDDAHNKDDDENEDDDDDDEEEKNRRSGRRRSRSRDREEDSIAASTRHGGSEIVGENRGQYGKPDDNAKDSLPWSERKRLLVMKSGKWGDQRYVEPNPYRVDPFNDEEEKAKAAARLARFNPEEVKRKEKEATEAAEGEAAMFDPARLAARAAKFGLPSDAVKVRETERAARAAHGALTTQNLSMKQIFSWDSKRVDPPPYLWPDKDAGVKQQQDIAAEAAAAAAAATATATISTIGVGEVEGGNMPADCKSEEPTNMPADTFESTASALPDQVDTVEVCPTKLHCFCLDVDARAFNKIRTPDIMEWLKIYHPVYIEWLGDRSFNAHFESPAYAAKALQELCEDLPPPPRMPSDESRVKVANVADPSGPVDSTIEGTAVARAGEESSTSSTGAESSVVADDPEPVAGLEKSEEIPTDESDGQTRAVEDTTPREDSKEEPPLPGGAAPRPSLFARLGTVPPPPKPKPKRKPPLLGSMGWRLAPPLYKTRTDAFGRRGLSARMLIRIANTKDVLLERPKKKGGKFQSNNNKKGRKRHVSLTGRSTEQREAKSAGIAPALSMDAALPSERYGPDEGDKGKRQRQ